MDGAASVIAIISLALSSTQNIYTTVSGFKSAPVIVQQIAFYLSHLSNVLQQLTMCNDSLYLVADLQGLVKQCAQDLESFERKIAKLSSPTDNRAERLWKNVKATLQVKDLDRMSALLQQHVTVLSLQMKLIGRTRSSTNTASLECLNLEASKQTALSTTNSNTLERVRQGVNEVYDKVKDCGRTSQASSESTRRALEELGERLHDFTDLSTHLSTEHSTTLNAILELLKEQSSAKAQNHAAEPMAPFDDLKRNKVFEAPDDDSLPEILNRLRDLAKEKDKTLFSAKAESITHDIEQILTISLQTEQDASPVRGGCKRRRGSYNTDSDDDQDLQYQSDIKRIKSFLTTSHCIGINEKVHRPSKVTPRSSELKVKSHRRRSRHGKFILRTCRRNHAVAIAQHYSAKDTQGEELGTLEASITFVPNAPQTTQIVATFHQRILYEGSFLQRPVLSVSALLPENSKVFSLIESGDLNGLRKALTLREACLTDRDRKGRSLLNYAIYSAKPHICKFLIDEGADVDFVERAISISNYEAHSLCADGWKDHDNEVEYFELTNQCRRLLLEAGADPTIGPYYDDTPYNFLRLTLDEGMTESLHLLLHYGLEFIGTDSLIRPDRLLHRLLDSPKWTLEEVTLLLRMAETTKLYAQNLDGCLHSALSGSDFVTRKELIKAIILLIRAGADVYAIDSDGVSVSGYACTRDRRYTYDDHLHKNHNLSLRDIWTEALTACGYDAEKVISSSLRSKELYGSEDNNELSDSKSNDNFQNEAADPSSNGSGYQAVQDLENTSRHDQAIFEPIRHTASQNTSWLPDSRFDTQTDWSTPAEVVSIPTRLEEAPDSGVSNNFNTASQQFLDSHYSPAVEDLNDMSRPDGATSGLMGQAESGNTSCLSEAASYNQFHWPMSTEVVSTHTQLEELPDSAGGDISDAAGEPFLDRLDCGTFGFTDQPESNDTSWLSDSAIHNQFAWNMLEEETNVWRE